MNKKRIFKYLRNLIIFFFASTLLSVVALRFIPVYITPLMVIRSVEQLAKGEKPVMKHHWVPKEKYHIISPWRSSHRKTTALQAIMASTSRKSARRWKKTKTEKSQGGQHHQPANSQKCILMAILIVGKKRIRSVFYGTD